MATTSTPSTTMKAVQYKAFNQPLSVSQVPIPKPAPHQVLLKIGAGGYCHTDEMVSNHEFDTKLPLIGSHEPAGTIVELGSEVSEEEFRVGQRVGALNFDSVCGVCPDCKAGLPIYCDNPKMKGITMDGAWAEYMVADAAFLVPLPDSLPFPIAAALMCAGITIYGSIIKAGVPKGGSIAIIGIGGLGHIGTQLAKSMGYTVLSVDAKQSALDLANSFTHKPDVSMLAGVDSVSDVLDKLEAVRLKPNEYGYKGVDAAILATDSPKSFKVAAEVTRKHGKLVLLGQPAGGITMSFQDVIFKDLTLVGSLLADVGTARELMRVVEKGGVTVNVKEWRVEQAEEMRQEYLEGRSRGKNVIVF